MLNVLFVNILFQPTPVQDKLHKTNDNYYSVIVSCSSHFPVAANIWGPLTDWPHYIWSVL